MLERRCCLIAPPSLQTFADCIRLALVGRCGAHIESMTLDAEHIADIAIVLVDAEHYDVAMNALGRWRVQFNAPHVIAVAHGLDVASLLGLLSAGVADFTTLPVDEDDLIARAQRAFANLDPAHDHHVHALPPPAIRGVIGTSPRFLRQVARIPTIAAYDAGVLILGETGTGKEVCAQAIHYLSPRADRPWVAVNCAAIPHELIEDELFGHVKGAYTHAMNHRSGLVREAEGGTLFLDEIDSLPYSAQAKLLRFLQDKEYRPVGANAIQHANVRIVAASNRNLAQLVARGAFRQDLYFRLNLFTLNLPPLRERRDDIPTLAAHFLRLAARQWKRPLPRLSPSGLKALIAYDWPGNVRELKHAMERAVLLATTPDLRADDFELGSMSTSDECADGESFRVAKARVVESFERGYIEQLLASVEGNVTRAAQAAKKNRRAFFELMRKYGIESERFRCEAK